MKKILIATLALTTIAATPTFAAPTMKRTQLSQHARAAYARYVPPYRDYVIFDNRVIGRDPDLNIRAGILRDPVQNEY
jgi:hypothetical protein